MPHSAQASISTFSLVKTGSNTRQLNPFKIRTLNLTFHFA